MTILCLFTILALATVGAACLALAERAAHGPPPAEPPPASDTRSHPYRDDRESRIATVRSRVEDIEHELLRAKAEIAALKSGR